MVSSHVLGAPRVRVGVGDLLSVDALVEALLEAGGAVDAVPAVPGRDLEPVRRRQRALVRRDP